LEPQFEDTGTINSGTANNVTGTFGVALQVGCVHGDVHIHHAANRPQVAVAASDGLHALIVEDEKPMQAELVSALRSDSRVGLVGTANDAAEALHYSREALRRGTPVQAWFLDISMPGMSGLQLAVAAHCFAAPPQVVFVSASDAHALDAFELQAVDYLVKPVEQRRLADTITRLIKN